MKPLLISLTLAALAGCASDNHRCRLAGYSKDEPRPLVEVLQPVRLAGTGGPTQVPATVKAYAIRRWIDPVNHRVMHEAGTVYRQEEDPRWNLQPGNRVVYGPYSHRDPHDAPGPVSQELYGELQRQRRITDALERKLNALQESPQNSEALLQATQQAVQNQRVLEQKLDAMTAMGKALQQQVQARQQTPSGQAANPNGEGH
jgi:hypothetical protein